MAILKYTTADGQTVKVNSYKVNNLVPQQTKGNDPNAVMSQKAVTDEVNQIGLEIDEITGQITTINSTLTTKANSADVYNKTEIDGIIQTANTAINSKLPIDSFNEWSEGVAMKDGVYSKTEADGKFITATDIADFVTTSQLNAVNTKADQNASDIATINTELTEINNTLGDCATNDALGELENIVSTKANKSALETEVTRATTAEGELDSRVEELENNRIIDCGTWN